MQRLRCLRYSLPDKSHQDGALYDRRDPCSNSSRVGGGKSMSEKSGFEPKIIGFLCNWCSYAGADLAGVSRIQYPPNIRIIRVMCSGRIDPTFVLEAFANGADGVMVM